MLRIKMITSLPLTRKLFKNSTLMRTRLYKIGQLKYKKIHTKKNRIQNFLLVQYFNIFQTMKYKETGR